MMTVFCRSVADLDQYVRYIVAGDDVAAIGFYEAQNQESTPGIGSACWRDRSGTYTLSDRAMGTVAPLECLRASGFNRCFWTLGVSHMPYNK